MSILTGFKRFKKFIKTDDGYMPSYDKTIASAVCFGDGTDDTDTVESRLSGIKGITTSNSVTEAGYAADASVVSEISNDITEIQDNIDTLNSSLTKQGSYELLTSCYTATSYEVPNISKFKSIYVALIMTSTNICADDTFMPVSIFKLGKTRQLNINYETYKYGNIQYVDDTTIKVSDISDGMYLTVWGVY